MWIKTIVLLQGIGFSMVAAGSVEKRGSLVPRRVGAFGTTPPGHHNVTKELDIMIRFNETALEQLQQQVRSGKETEPCLLLRLFFTFDEDDSVDGGGGGDNNEEEEEEEDYNDYPDYDPTGNGNEDYQPPPKLKKRSAPQTAGHLVAGYERQVARAHALKKRAELGCDFA